MTSVAAGREQREPVLFVAQNYPPMGGPGVHRSRRLVKHLRDCGYEPLVVTITEEDIDNYIYPRDDTLLDGLSDIETVRIPTKEPVKLRQLLAGLRLYSLVQFVLFPLFWEPFALWPFAAAGPVRKLAKERGIRLVYTSSGPFSGLVLGYLLAGRGLSWVADFRDPWTDGHVIKWPSKLHWAVARVCEKHLLSRARKVIVNTPAVKQLFEHRGLKQNSDICVITNGYE